MSRKVYEIVTEKIIAAIESGNNPWSRQWSGGPAMNWKSKKLYRGINTFLLEPGEYATFKQIQAARGTIKRGAKGSLVVFFKPVVVTDKESGDMKTIPYLRYYTVFNIADTTLTPRREARSGEFDPIQAGENILFNYLEKPSAPRIEYKGERACYKPKTDEINLPYKNSFFSDTAYYSTAFHELVHSTGHKSRLDRLTPAWFGDEQYSKEELVAEMGAAMLCALAGIENEMENQAAYLRGWLKPLKNDITLAVKAASLAQKAADLITDGLNVDKEEEEEGE